MWLEYGCMGFLGICAVYDYRTRRIPVWLFVLFGIFGFCVRFLKGNLFDLSVAAGVCTGAGIWLLGKWTKDKIGEGDGIMLMITGLYLGVWQNLELCLTALLMTLGAAVWILLLKKGDRSTKIPFAPFLLIAYALLLLLEGLT